MSAFSEMIARTAQPGHIRGIFLRPERLAPVRAVEHAEIGMSGLSGDHARQGKRSVTLIMEEHLPVIAGVLGREVVSAVDLRRNLLVAGINLNALKGRQVEIGTAVLEITGICAPCSRMERILGQGGYSAMRGHGGWCASVVRPGQVALGDVVTPHQTAENMDRN